MTWHLILAMYSTWSRGNAVLSFASTVIGIMMLCNSLSVFFMPSPNVPISFAIKEDSVSLYRHRYFNCDALLFNFDLDVDLSEVFNWNTKHVFVYVIANYETEDTKKNEVVVWDQLVETKEESVISLKDYKVEYPLLDYKTGLRGTEVRFTIQWSVSPVAGLIYDSIPEHLSFIKPASLAPVVSYTIQSDYNK